MDKKIIWIGVGVAVVAVLILTLKPGAAAAAGHAVGEAAVDAVGGAVTGVLDVVSEKIGIPTTDETITDVQQCKIYMDQHGVWAASFQCGAPAYIGALTS